jgi:heme/copper-type cytochrome/quinol oxidase subunit 2
MHVSAPDKETELRDQEQFDDSVAKTGKVVLGALAGAGIVAALLMSIVALNQSSERSTVTVTTGVPAPAAAGSSSAAASKTPAKVIDLEVIGGSRLGPDGKKHDVFTKTEFAVKVGQPLDLKIDNTDDVEHSITSPQVGVNIIVKPGVHTYRLIVKEAGRFSWFCVIPCDSDANGWAMQHAGYMSGFITAT